MLVLILIFKITLPVSYGQKPDEMQNMLFGSFGNSLKWKGNQNFCQI